MSMCANTYGHICRIYKKLLGPIPSKQISLLKGLANLSGSPHSDKKLQEQGFL